MPLARRRQILVAPRSVTNASEVVIRARLDKLCAYLARPVNFRMCPVRPHVICVKKLRTLVAKQETGRALIVQPVGHPKKAAPSVNPARLENMAMLWERSVKIVRLVTTGRLPPMLKHVQHVHWDTHKTKKVKHHGEYLFSFLFLLLLYVIFD